MASPLILAGQDLTAGQGQAQLSQYYGYSDATATTVTATAATDLSTLYTIPAGEPYAGAAYELSCAGFGTWGSTQQALTLNPLLGSGAVPIGRVIAATAFSASAVFNWSVIVEMICSDGVSSWQVSYLGAIVETASPLAPGTAATNAVPFAAATSSAFTAAISSAVPVAFQAKWASATGASTITNVRTSFRKVA